MTFTAIIATSITVLCCVFQLIDFYRFEETFRIDRQPKAVDSEDSVDGGGDGESPRTERRMSRRVETVSLLENNRMRNVGQSAAASVFTDHYRSNRN